MRKIKRKKLNIKKLSLLLIPIILILVITLNFNRIVTLYQSKVTGYEYDTINVFHELNVYNDIKKHTHSDTLEKIVISEYYNPKYLKDYLDINYQNKDNFFENINKLLTLGYTKDDINMIYQKLSDNSISILIENEYLKDIVNILNLSYFHEDNLKRYLEYNNDNLSSENLVTYVNANLDYKYYTNVINIDEPEKITVLVNKYHKLDNNYVPNDLEAINPKYNQGFNNKMRKVAKEAFEEMCEGALNDGITIYSGSAYRSYSYQQSLYNRYVATNGFDNAETFSARAGYSEHQTGLATDIMNKNLDFISKNDKEYDWLINNSYKYGFILRYPEGKENITGYMYEEWHFRYLGKDIAKELYDLDITYDEYVARK